MACSSLLPIISRYLSFLFFGLLVFTCIVHSAPPPARQSVIPTAIDYNAILERYPLVSRAGKQTWFTNTRWTTTWVGKVSCQKVHPNTLQSFGQAIAKNAYDSMLVDIHEEKLDPKWAANVIATLCIPGQSCWVASIPRGPDATAWVAEMMRTVPQWLESYGPQLPNSLFHSEDLALALASQDGVRYPYSVDIDGTTYQAIVNVYGVYDMSKGNNPPMDRFGEAGIRWPCASAGQNRNGRETPCTKVLKQLGIDFTYKP
jgi:hypothetical protein